MADETRTVLDEEWRAAFGGVVGAHGERLLNTDDEPIDMARSKIAVQGKRALVLLLQASTCPTCAGPMTDHAPGCAMGAVLAEVGR
jgi:hypothetical protein